MKLPTFSSDNHKEECFLASLPVGSVGKIYAWVVALKAGRIWDFACCGFEKPQIGIHDSKSKVKGDIANDRINPPSEGDI